MRRLALAVGAGTLVWLWLRFSRRYARFEVDGVSMLPALRPGDWVIVDRRAYERRAPRGGELALARDPREPRRTLVKRVARREADGALWLLGDNALVSTDSRSLGAFPSEALLGRVRWRYWPPPLGALPGRP